MKASLVLFVIFISAFGCHSSKTISEKEYTGELVNSDPQLLFASYKFNGEELELINKIITAGKLKGNREQTFDPSIGDLLFQQLDIDKELLAEKIVSNPRIRIVEYVDDNGSFQKKAIDIDNPEFTMRVDLHLKAKYLAIKEVNSDSSNSILIISEI